MGKAAVRGGSAGDSQSPSVANEWSGRRLQIAGTGKAPSRSTCRRSPRRAA